MKNIFLLATNESSRLGLHSNNQLVLHINALTKNLPHFKPQHIYNTSDEEIKKGDWFLDLTDNTLWRNQGPESMSRILFPECKKIILTTDATLIADGVQEIDDTFLEWFIKNPTCDYV